MKKLLKVILSLAFLGSICPAYGMLCKNNIATEQEFAGEIARLAGIFYDKNQNNEMLWEDKDFAYWSDFYDRGQASDISLESKQKMKEIFRDFFGEEFIDPEKRNIFKAKVADEWSTYVAQLINKKQSFWQRTKQAITNNKLTCAVATAVTGLGLTYGAYKAYKNLLYYPMCSYASAIQESQHILHWFYK